MKPLALLCAFASLVPSAALAADAPAATPEVAAAADAPDPPDWSLGVGVGFGSVYVLGLGGTGGLGGLSVTPAVLVERRLAGPVWLLFQVSAAHNRTTSDTLDSATTATSVGGDVGVRYVFNPEDAFQVSAWVTIGARWSTYDDPSALDSTGTAVSGNLGVSLDRELIDGLFLRLGLKLFSAGYSAQENVIRSDLVRGSEPISSESAFARLDLSPSLELRYTF